MRFTMATSAETFSIRQNIVLMLLVFAVSYDVMIFATTLAFVVRPILNKFYP